MTNTGKPEQTGGGTRSVERALSLLTAFSEEQPELRINELVAASGLGQSTVSRLVGALTNLQFLVQDERTGHYRVGPQVIRLAGIALNQSETYQHARQLAQNLAHSLGMGVNIAERHVKKLFYLANYEGAQFPRSSTLVGRSGPLHATALGKALISEMPENDINSLLGVSYSAYTPRTVTELSALITELEQVRGRGYAVENEEMAFGRACVAAPIRDRSGVIVAALSISGPLSIMNLSERELEISRAAIEHADQVSTALGYHGAPF